MDLDRNYDQKFEEMKKYIPFLESMIQRLESTGVSSGNPRQAQLDKIRSLRDLLLDKKKRMKMENLLKCEQVLVNLYAKVEQRDTKCLPETPTEQKTTDKTDLTVVRNKLKSVIKRSVENTDTLPEIARAHDVDVSTSGSKEPALFQRRPNKFSKSPYSSPTMENVNNSPQTSKRSYTRVLMSPDTSSKRWDRNPSDKILFSRRSPRKSPRRLSPAYGKKERKKFAKRNVDSKRRKDWNITLNVPAESLNSLNTTDILSRIINCSDGDVDIDTLRELRSQILVELKQTNSNDDISDLILKSYKKKKSKSNIKGSKEVEEGELSDSESEAIQSIYSSLVVVEKDASNEINDKRLPEHDQPRKIQICLMINPDKNDGEKSNNDDSKIVDVSDFEMFKKDTDVSTGINEKQVECKTTDQNKLNTVTVNDSIIEKDTKQDVSDEEESKTEIIKIDDEISPVKESDTKTQSDEIVPEPRKFKANFYEPLTEQVCGSGECSVEKNTSDAPNTDKSKDKPTDNAFREVTALKELDSNRNSYEQGKKEIEIPLLNDRLVPTEPPKNPAVSEIEILQALKNDILSEIISLPGSAAGTPALHQPKVIKVAKAQEILPKKRISIEKYKQKSVSSNSKNMCLYLNDQSLLLDNGKKSSLKLTDKECERFNLTKLALDNDDDSDDDDVSTSDIYEDLVPKSPDREESNEITSTPPVIIPVDPVKVTTAIAKADIDMRTLVPMPLIAPSTPAVSSIIPSSIISDKPDSSKSESHKTDDNKTPLTDPRMRRDVNTSLNMDANPERPPLSTPLSGFTNVAPNMAPIMNPNLAPALYPSMTSIMTPSHQSIEIESNRKHVYAFDARDSRENSVVKDTRWDKRDDVPENHQDNSRSTWDESHSNSIQRDIDLQNSRYGNSSKNGLRSDRFPKRDSYNRSECPLTPSHGFGRSDTPITPIYSLGSIDSSTPIHPFGRSDCPPAPSHSFGRLDCPPTPSHSFGRSECPPTPSHPFGRSDCPPTPSHPFGRSDCPPTPSHPFGRSDCPPTPSHSFGRSDCPPLPSHPFSRLDCPPTPSHSFGRSECPSTPIHPFGRSDIPMTPSHQFGRSDFSRNKYNKDPRLNRSTEYESTYKNKTRDYYKDSGFDQGNSYSRQSRSFSKPDTYRQNDRERGNKYRHYSDEQYYRYNNREMYRHEPSVSRAMSNDYEDERNSYRGSSRDHYRNEVVKSYEEVGMRRNFTLERKIGRNMPEDKFCRSKTSNASSNFESGGDNSLSVTRDTGRSFTINTSVKSTFQDVLASGNEIQVFNYSFDARRQRASSVGRSVPRESSVGRTLFQPNLKDSKEDWDNSNRRNHFRRACSVGRELASSKTNRSFSEVKADFENYSRSIKIPPRRESVEEKREEKLQDATAQNSRSKKNMFSKDFYRKSNDTKQLYSPRNNNRDPRMRREMQSGNKRRDGKEWRDTKKYGMVYSNDNIAKGRILGSGYGVRNYKIPKIKRPVEEKEVEKEDKTQIIENKESSTESNKSASKKIDKSVGVEEIKNTDSKTIDIKDLSDVREEVTEEVPGKRITRSSKTSELNIPGTKKVINLRRSKRAVFHDSDSEIESDKDNIQPADKNTKTHNALSSPGKKPTEEQKSNERIDVEQDSLSSFCVDDLDMFSENMVSDPVIDNINALIADLDNDIDTKNDADDKFTNELTVENMLESITGMASNDKKTSEPQSCKVEESYEKSNITHPRAVDELLHSPKENLSDSPSTNKADSFEENLAQSTDAKVPNCNKPASLKNTENNEAIVSTTEAEPEVSNKKDVSDERSHDGCSTPDSTINTNGAVSDLSREEKGLADSTNVDHAESEMNSDVTSTHSTESIEKAPAEPNISHRETIPALESFGNLLSILQDKGKIKELLSMLGEGSSENEKIKKKLEKLSEIVSDEEDTRDETDKDDIIYTNKAADFSDITEQLASNIEHSDTVDSLQTYKCEPDRSNDIDVQPSEVKTAQLVSNEPALPDNDKDKIMQPDKEKNKLDLVPQEEERSGGKDPEEHQEKYSNLKADVGPELVDDSKIPETKNVKGDRIEKIMTNESEIENKDVIESAVIVKHKPEKKTVVKKSKFVKKGKGKGKPISLGEPKRVTRSAVGNPDTIDVKKPSREVLKLQEDIKEMFMKDDTLNTTGIRMCRLAKLVDEKITKDVPNIDIEPVVVLEKFKDAEKLEPSKDKPMKKKPGPKQKKSKLKKTSLLAESGNKKEERSNNTKYKPGPKSKMKPKVDEVDPYDFDTDSLCDTSIRKASYDGNATSSDSENESLASSFGSSEILSDIKKKRRRRPGWKAGVIKSKKRKMDKKQSEPYLASSFSEELLPARKPLTIPDLNCFVDKTYCFENNIFTYSCRLCEYTGTDIVHHHKKNHPHCEVPLSRLNTIIAKEAIEQCELRNFRMIMTMPSEKYVCRFCSKEFFKTKAALEKFFWHVVSTHTGEYQQNCSECVTDTACPFAIDIPPPHGDKAQLLGYICGKCNFTQISLENLKTHVILRHDDEETDVFAISLSEMTKKAILALSKRCEVVKEKRTLRSLRSQQSLTEASDDRSDITDSSSRISEIESPQSKLAESDPSPMIEEKLHCALENSVSVQSQITFETYESSEISTNNVEKVMETYVKMEADEVNNEDTTHLTDNIEHEINNATDCNDPPISKSQSKRFSKDVFKNQHFKFTQKSNKKTYVCCIDGEDNHYSTSLLISMKRHIKAHHKDTWDGYCFLCKVIITPQGLHPFNDCLAHYIDKHDNEILEVGEEKIEEQPAPLAVSVPQIPDPEPLVERTASPKSYINVRPLAELIVKNVETELVQVSPQPKIENAASLGVLTVDLPSPSPTYPTTCIVPRHEPEKLFSKYEEVQADVMTKKYRVVLENMMRKEKLLQVFKCAGRFCSYTSDLVEEALDHASTHQRIGGIDALNCAYCDFDSSGNAIDLVMHVFKVHGRCQYSCGMCFYRGAASQLVGAHIERIHGEKAANTIVLRTTHVSQPVREDVSYMLTREEAVSYYVCAHGDNDNICKFRTYTPGKFYEHLQQRHLSATVHPCDLCSTLSPTAKHLIEHMKNHNYKLYQCTWCVHGAETETELLHHSSIHHPTKQPQAYLRIVTNKDGSREQRVLPLVYLNKTKVQTEDVSPDIEHENATREAQRSVDLEKLIGHTTMMIESAESSAVPTSLVEEPVSTDIIEDITDTSPDMEPVVPEAPVETVTTEMPRIVTPPPSMIHDLSSELTPVLKTENVELTTSPPTTRSNDEIVCLDSDEEEESSKESTVCLKEDEHTVARTEPCPMRYKKISEKLIYKCPLCPIIPTTDMEFRKHRCFMYPLARTHLYCAHCQSFVPNFSDLQKHVKNCHGPNPYICGICERMSFGTLKAAKKHAFTVHKLDKRLFQCVSVSGEEKRYVVSEGMDPVPRTTTRQTSRFGPHDVDKLPINPIMDSLVYCAVCEFSTKVRLNMVRHLQLHAEQQPAPNTAPVNPVPHLETNEMHFDRMQNLASSSVSTRPAQAQAPTPSLAIIPMRTVPRSDVGIYPKFVPDRQRYTCGAKGCDYISIDMTMFRRHWEALHTDYTEFNCAHCLPHQPGNQLRPLSINRIISHLKMHDVSLYACSACAYYHNRTIFVENHLMDIHKGEGHILVVREEKKDVSTPSPQPSSAPTMDLKPWQCGLCEFKSMLRPEVVEHCTKTHQSKMQYGCTYCSYRAPNTEFVNKHALNTHPGKSPDMFYYYYREGSIPDEDGTPRWKKQRQDNTENQPEVKREVPDVTPPGVQTQPSTSKALSIDLNLVKKELDVYPEIEASDDELIARYGPLCEPNGIKYKCPLCKVVSESTVEAMQSHLFEELKYRKWSCAICSYKAFHKTGLKEHMAAEHGRAAQQPVQLPIDVNIEKWVVKQLDHQAAIILMNKEKLSMQKIQTVSPAKEKPKEKVPEVSSQKEPDEKELESAFGTFGEPSQMRYCCPKCNQPETDPTNMRDHLEMELSKIRWSCSECASTFQTYHEAQYHCRCMHPPGARPIGATRDPALRAAWVTAVIKHQASLLNTNAPQQMEPEENSLLVVRYEVPTLEAPQRRKRPCPVSDDERLDEGDTPAKKKMKCQYCDYATPYAQSLRQHTVKHYNLRPFSCPYCNMTGTRAGVQKHVESSHPDKLVRVINTEIPNHPPINVNVPKRFTKKHDEDSKVLCLYCEKLVQANNVAAHTHRGVQPEYATIGSVVIKCGLCLVLRLDLNSHRQHHATCHPDMAINYSFVKVKCDPREMFQCCHCCKSFVFLKDLESHHNAVHNYLTIKYTLIKPSTGAIYDENTRRKSLGSDTEPKRVAKKSTTKLPMVCSVAKKSTTKLPTMAYDSDSDEEYTFYGQKPLPTENYAHVTTLMPFFNNMVPFTLKNLGKIINIDPKVTVKDYKKQ